MPTATASSPRPSVGRWRAQGEGAALFLFIPVVLYLFVRHPEPVGGSLVVGIVLMLGHRFLARPWMERIHDSKCLWCNRMLPTGEAEELTLEGRGGRLVARFCRGHRRPAARYFACLAALRWPLSAGIFVPLLLLLASLAAVALGGSAPVGRVTALFQLVVGVTVNVAALGYVLARESEPARVPFPLHNFFLLGVRNLLWIFRIVGVWWIVVGALALVR